MKGSAILAIFVIATLGISEAASADYKNVAYAQPGTHAFFLGTVDGKSYLADNTTLRNWTDSVTFCESVGMRLATVTTQEQTDFIQGIDNPNFIRPYWMAARDATSPQQFAWKYNDLPWSGDLLTFWTFQPAYTCVGFSAQPEYKKYFSRPCTNLYGALCESV